MHSSLVSKIDKAHRYASEPARIQLGQIAATFHGSHDDYLVRLDGGAWTCTCHTSSAQTLGGTCSHIMALQQLLDPMLMQSDKVWQVPEQTE